MSLPKSLDDFNVSDPFGVPMLQIHPADFTQSAETPELLKVTLREYIKDFFAQVSGGDAVQMAAMNAAVFEGTDFAKKTSYILNRTALAAQDENYVDAHTLCVKGGVDEKVLAGVVIMPRGERGYSDFVQMMTGVDGAAFGAAPVDMKQLHFMTQWHEFSHTTGANEPQADKMAAIVARQVLGTPVLQTYADLRAIDALFDYNSKTDPETGQPERQDIYGWRLVEAIDSVIAMPQEKVDAMDENSIRDLAKTPLPHAKQDALKKLGQMLFDIAPDLVNPKTADLKKTGAALQTLLKSGALKQDNPAHDIATRSLHAIDRLAADRPAVDISLKTKSRFVLTPPPQKQPEKPMVLKAPKQPHAKPPSL